MKSVRSTIFKRFPRTQIPDYFRSWDDYAKYVELLVRTNCIDDGRKIWWDIRPHAYFKTLEFRICDIPCRAEETVAIAALVPGPGGQAATACSSRTWASAYYARADHRWRTSSARSSRAWTAR